MVRLHPPLDPVRLSGSSGGSRGAHLPARIHREVWQVSMETSRAQVLRARMSSQDPGKATEVKRPILGPYIVGFLYRNTEYIRIPT